MAIALYVVSDLDGTLVFYGAGGATKVSSSRSVVSLPPSSTGRIGTIAEATLKLLTDIERLLPRRLVAASGARASTVLQRACTPYLSSFSYLICENGGRIFERDKDDASVLVELDFARQLFAESEEGDYDVALTGLRAFADFCVDRGYELDRNGYVTMFRIKCRNRQEEEDIMASLPLGLRHTKNLEFLDIQLAPFSKKTSVAWLLGKLEANKSSEAYDYYFLGDDDNDIECAAAARECFISNPCFPSMRSWLASSTSTAISADRSSSSQTYQRQSRPYRITVPRPSIIDHDGCIANLEALKKRLVEGLHEIF